MNRRDDTARQRDPMVSLPSRSRTPGVELARRIGLSLILLLIATLIVVLEPGGYSDNVNHDGVSFIDALYYATVTVTTTGYGDITPVSQLARFLNIVLVTPLRIGFLVLLVGTTLEVLANDQVRAIKDHFWRKRMRDHTIIVGFGTKGRAALRTVIASGVPLSRVLVLDDREEAIARANREGVVALQGDSTKLNVLKRVEVGSAKEMIVTLDRDDTAILTTLAARQLSPGLHVVVAVRDEAKIPMLLQSGADDVVQSSDVVGRLMGLSSVSPSLGLVLEDLLSTGEGLEVTRRAPLPQELGGRIEEQPGERVLAVIRDGDTLPWYRHDCAPVRPTDMLVIVKPHDDADVSASP